MSHAESSCSKSSLLLFCAWPNESIAVSRENPQSLLLWKSEVFWQTLTRGSTHNTSFLQFRHGIMLNCRRNFGQVCIGCFSVFDQAQFVRMKKLMPSLYGHGLHGIVPALVGTSGHKKNKHLHLIGSMDLLPLCFGCVEECRVFGEFHELGSILVWVESDWSLWMLD